MIRYPWLSPARVLDHGATGGACSVHRDRRRRLLRELPNGPKPTDRRSRGFRSLRGTPSKVRLRLGCGTEVAATVVDVSARGAPHCRSNERPARRLTSSGPAFGSVRLDRTAFGPADPADQTARRLRPTRRAVCGGWVIGRLVFGHALMVAKLQRDRAAFGPTEPPDPTPSG